MSKNTSFRVSNESSQAERRAVIANDRRIHKGASYSQLAASEADTVSGRYAAQAKTHVVGSSSFAYPRQPGSSWSNQAAAVPREEPIGIDVNAVEPLGTAREIEQSLREMRDGADAPSASSPDSPSSGAGSDASQPTGIVSSETAPLRSRKQRRRRG